MGYSSPEYKRALYAKNREKILEQQRMLRRLHPERVKKQNDKYKAKNPDKIRMLNKAYYNANKKKRIEYSRSWSRANRDKVNKRNAKWRKQNPEKMQAYRNAWLKENLQRRRTYEKRYYSTPEIKKHRIRKSATRYKKDKDRILRKTKEWQRANPEVCKQIRARRRAIIKNAPIGDLKEIIAWEKSWRSLAEVECAYCHGMLPPKQCDSDHIIPLSRGGPHTKKNLTIACATCNRSKHNKTLEEWRAA